MSGTGKTTFVNVTFPLFRPSAAVPMSSLSTSTPQSERSPMSLWSTSARPTNTNWSTFNYSDHEGLQVGSKRCHPDSAKPVPLAARERGVADQAAPGELQRARQYDSDRHSWSDLSIHLVILFPNFDRGPLDPNAGEDRLFDRFCPLQQPQRLPQQHPIRTYFYPSYLESIQYRFAKYDFTILLNKCDCGDTAKLQSWISDYEIFMTALSEDSSYLATLSKSVVLHLSEFY